MKDGLASSAESDAIENAAIAKVILAETLAYQNKDFEAWAACFVQDERTHDVLASNTAGLTVLEGWPAVASHMERVFSKGLATNLVEFGQENMRIYRCGDVAWAAFDSWSHTAEGAHLRSFDTRILQRISGQWKIVFNLFVQREIKGPNGNFIGVDGGGKVAWASIAAIELLEGHPFLLLKNGRLRARSREWNKKLQAAISRASDHHGFFETHKVADESGGPPTYPVVLGKDENGGLAILHFSIRDCITYVRISGDEDLERRLQAARNVFGLSLGQLRVAREIALGKSLKMLAGNLGISTTTARTHLSRIYDKTGVRTQTALVRLLLSVG